MKRGGFIVRNFGELRKIVVLLTLAAACVSCAWLTSTSKSAISSVVDCTKGAAPAAIAQFGPVVDSLLVLATGGDGKIDRALVKDATRSFALDVGGCVLAKAVAKIAAAPPAGSDAPKASALVPDATGLLGELYPGVEFKL